MRHVLVTYVICSATAVTLQSANSNVQRDQLQMTTGSSRSLRPLVTFIIPTKGRESLNKTLASLSSQTQSDWEAVIVCDHLSSCPTWNERRIKSVNAENKLGRDIDSAGLVRNKAFPLVTTEYLAFVDDDDTLDSEYVSTLRKEVAQKPDAVVLRMCHTDGYTLPCKQDVADQNFRKGYVGISFALRTDLVRKEGWKFYPSESEDFDLLDRMRQAGKKIVVSDSIRYYIKGAVAPPDQDWRVCGKFEPDDPWGHYCGLKKKKKKNRSTAAAARKNGSP